MRTTEILTQTISLSDIEKLSENYKQVVFLNSNKDTSISYLALGSKAEFKPEKNQVFDGLKSFVKENQDWVFGYLSYDLKNEVEPSLSSKNKDHLNFPEVHFFVPEIVVELTVDFTKIHFTKNEQKDLFISFLGEKSKKTTEKPSKVNFKQRMSKENYEQRFEAIKEHIQQGDIYEMNFCHEFYAENVEINPFGTYTKLNELTNAPFSVFYKNESQFVLCGSPERYIKKEANKIISQPIKGTAKRLTSKIEDDKIASDLAKNIKERAENVMIVDLVRNDLSKSAKKGSVKVEELCKVYSFKQVHQMISTIVSEIEPNTHPVTVLKDTFPMGSMTGAPKVSAMRIIENIGIL